MQTTMVHHYMYSDDNFFLERDNHVVPQHFKEIKNVLFIFFLDRGQMHIKAKDESLYGSAKKIRTYGKRKR